MARRLPFQLDKPVFVKVPFRANTREYKQGDQFKWQGMKLDWERVHTMYEQGYLFHDDELEAAAQVIGDGLPERNLDELHNLVDAINVKVKANTKTQKEYGEKACKKSQIKDKQIGLIRSWRGRFGKYESM